jgi:hypothetical protein
MSRGVIGASAVRGITGRWPDVLNGYGQPDSTRAGSRGERGVHVSVSFIITQRIGLEDGPADLPHLSRQTRFVHRGRHDTRCNGPQRQLAFNSRLAAEIHDEIVETTKESRELAVTTKC